MSRSSSHAYKRRRPSIVKNLWVYRRMVLLAVLLGVLLWFILINNTPVIVSLPFGLGQFSTRSGIAILLGAVAGAIAAFLGITVLWALRRQRQRQAEFDPSDVSGAVARARGADQTEDRPPADYAARTKEGFPELPESAR